MAQNTITVNKVTYNTKPFDFSLVLDLEDLGVNLMEVDSKPMNLVVAYFALCANVSKDMARELVQNHVVNGGNFDDIAIPMTKEMEASDFFRALSKKKDEETSERKRKKSESEELAKSINP